MLRAYFGMEGRRMLVSRFVRNDQKDLPADLVGLIAKFLGDYTNGDAEFSVLSYPPQNIQLWYSTGAPYFVLKGIPGSGSQKNVIVLEEIKNRSFKTYKFEITKPLNCNCASKIKAEFGAILINKKYKTSDFLANLRQRRKKRNFCQLVKYHKHFPYVAGAWYSINLKDNSGYWGMHSGKNKQERHDTEDLRNKMSMTIKFADYLYVVGDSFERAFAITPKFDHKVFVVCVLPTCECGAEGIECKMYDEILMKGWQHFHSQM